MSEDTVRHHRSGRGPRSRRPRATDTVPLRAECPRCGPFVYAPRNIRLHDVTGRSTVDTFRVLDCPRCGTVIRLSGALDHDAIRAWYSEPSSGGAAPRRPPMKPPRRTNYPTRGNSAASDRSAVRRAEVEAFFDENRDASGYGAQFDAVWKSTLRRVPPLEDWHAVLYPGSHLVVGVLATDNSQRFYQILRRDGALAVRAEGFWIYGSIWIGAGGIVENETRAAPSEKFRFKTLRDAMKAVRSHWTLWGSRPVIQELHTSFYRPKTR